MALFTVADARAFPYQGQTPLASSSAYSDDLISAAADRITEEFAAICGVAFAPTARTVTFDGDYTSELYLPDPLVTAVTTVETWTGSTWQTFSGTARVLDERTLYYDGGIWPFGRAQVRVTYTHGYDTPPAAIVRAALILCVDQLTGSNVSDRATQQTNENGTFNLAVPGWRTNQYYGLPVVDSVLARERARWNGPRVG